MKALSLLLALVMLAGRTFAADPPPADDINDVFDGGENEKRRQPPLPSVEDINAIFDGAKSTQSPSPTMPPPEPKERWIAWPVDLDRANPVHQDVMHLVGRSIIRKAGGKRFLPHQPVTRCELLDWLIHVELWVRAAKIVRSLDVEFRTGERLNPAELVVRMGLVAPGHPLDGDRPVDEPFMEDLRLQTERAWSIDPSAPGRIQLSPGKRDREAVALWLKNLAQELFSLGRPPTTRFKLSSRAHIPVLLVLLDDRSASAREMATRALSGLDNDAFVLLAGKRYEKWFSDPHGLESLPEVAVGLGLQETPLARQQFAEVMRLITALRDPDLDRRFVVVTRKALAKAPPGVLPKQLLRAVTGLMAEHGRTEVLDTLLVHGMPALEVLVPFLEQQTLDPAWTERLAYGLEAGLECGALGQGLVPMLRFLAHNPRIPDAVRASALDRLDLLGETEPTSALVPLVQRAETDRSPGCERLAMIAGRMLARQEPPPSRKPPVAARAVDGVRIRVDLLTVVVLLLAGIELGRIVWWLAGVLPVLPLLRRIGSAGAAYVSRTVTPIREQLPGAIVRLGFSSLQALASACDRLERARLRARDRARHRAQQAPSSPGDDGPARSRC